MTITPAEFVKNWNDSILREQQGAQLHFFQLVELLGLNPSQYLGTTGEGAVFEQHVEKTDGGAGRADVWYAGRFAWEYKGKLKDLDSAYAQLLSYRASLDNPPVLVVCDFLEYRIYPQWPNLSGQPIKLLNHDLLDDKNRQLLRWVLTDPEKIKHKLEKDRSDSEKLTEQLAKKFADLSDLMRQHPIGEADKKWEPMQIARFLTKLVFALFVEDVGLLPQMASSPMFRFIIEGARQAPEGFVDTLTTLFKAMNGETTHFVLVPIPYFNGGIFAESAPGRGDGLEVLDITEIPGALDILGEAADADWRSVNPTIFGTLFEGALDTSKRAQLGAHYTSEADIRLVIDPVLMEPLLRDWTATQAEAAPLMLTFLDPTAPPKEVAAAAARLRELRDAMYDRLAATTVLDPACGSGNFLYVALKALKDLEGKVRDAFRALAPDDFRDVVTPRQFFGIEKDTFAARLAHVVMWIGYLQWRYEDEGALYWQQPRKQPHPRALPNPIIQDKLKPTDPDRVTNDDAILRYDADGKPYEPEWPPASIIIGNPPFLGGKMMRGELLSGYVDDLFKLYAGRIPAEADLVTYWFERARAYIEAGTSQRAGFISTNSIRGGANRKILDRIKASGDIFMAWDDNPWVLKGAAVRISIVGFAREVDQPRKLNGKEVEVINSNLANDFNAATASRLTENMGLAYMGVTPAGPFEVRALEAENMIKTVNSNGVNNRDVVKPLLNASDLVGRSRRAWIIDFGIDMAKDDAIKYEAVFNYVDKVIKPKRLESRQPEREKAKYWLFTRSRPEMRQAIENLSRFVVTPAVSKHRLFAWINKGTVADHALLVFARDDDYFFGVLHSYIHEIWSLRLGTSLGKGNDPRYTPTTTFETFPFPFAPGHEPGGKSALYAATPPAAAADGSPAALPPSPLAATDSPLPERLEDSIYAVRTIAAAAAALHTEREAWLNPPEWLSMDADQKALKERTLTNLYNAVAAHREGSGRRGKIPEVALKFAPRIAALHDALDAAVLSAYGWSDLVGRLRSPDGDEELLRRLLAENLKRAGGA